MHSAPWIVVSSCSEHQRGSVAPSKRSSPFCFARWVSDISPGCSPPPVPDAPDAPGIVSPPPDGDCVPAPDVPDGERDVPLSDSVPVGPCTPGVLVVLSTPEVPAAPEVPDVPLVPDVPPVSEAPDVSPAPEMPDVPLVPEVPDVSPPCISLLPCVPPAEVPEDWVSVALRPDKPRAFFSTSAARPGSVLSRMPPDGEVCACAQPAASSSDNNKGETNCFM